MANLLKPGRAHNPLPIPPRSVAQAEAAKILANHESHAVRVPVQTNRPVRSASGATPNSGRKVSGGARLRGGAKTS